MDQTFGTNDVEIENDSDTDVAIEDGETEVGNEDNRDYVSVGDETLSIDEEDGNMATDEEEVQVISDVDDDDTCEVIDVDGDSNEFSDEDDDTSTSTGTDEDGNVVSDDDISTIVIDDDEDSKLAFEDSEETGSDPSRPNHNSVDVMNIPGNWAEIVVSSQGLDPSTAGDDEPSFSNECSLPGKSSWKEDVSEAVPEHRYSVQDQEGRVPVKAAGVGNGTSSLSEEELMIQKVRDWLASRHNTPVMGEPPKEEKHTAVTPVVQQSRETVGAGDDVGSYEGVDVDGMDDEQK